MADISLPEVRLKEKLPEGLREMSVEDIQRAVPELHLPKLTASKEVRRARKEAGKAAQHAEEAARQVQKAAAHQADRAARAVERSLPRRPGPNPTPFVLLAVVGGLVAGWVLATSPTTGPRIAAWVEDLRMRWNEWRGGASDYDEEMETEPQAFTESLRAPVQPERYSGNMPAAETGVAVGPGSLPEGMGTSDPARAGADDQA